MTIKSLASESCNWLDSRLRGNDILVAQTDSSKTASFFPTQKIRSKLGGLIRTRSADCLTEPDIVCPIVAKRLVPA